MTRLATLEGHDRSCGGCPACSEEMARVLAMNPAEHAGWLKGKNMQLRSATQRVFRTTDQPKPIGRDLELERRVEAEIARLEALPPAPIDMAARIRAARETPDRQSALREQMLAGVSYDHM